MPRTSASDSRTPPCRSGIFKLASLETDDILFFGKVHKGIRGEENAGYVLYIPLGLLSLGLTFGKGGVLFLVNKAVKSTTTLPDA